MVEGGGKGRGGDGAAGLSGSRTLGAGQAVILLHHDRMLQRESFSDSEGFRERVLQCF